MKIYHISKFNLEKYALSFKYGVIFIKAKIWKTDSWKFSFELQRHHEIGFVMQKNLNQLNSDKWSTNDIIHVIGTSLNRLKLIFNSLTSHFCSYFKQHFNLTRFISTVAPLIENFNLNWYLNLFFNHQKFLILIWVIN